MSATPPQTSSEYSRGTRGSRGASARSGEAGAAAGAGVSGSTRGLILAGGLLGALLLFAAEFTTLYEVRGRATGRMVKSVATGANHDYALALIALLVAFLAVGFWRTAARPALLAIGVLGLIALAISLAGDLPQAHASGLLRLHSGRLVLALSSPSAGFYMETLGAVLLLITCVCGFVLLGPPRSGLGGPRSGLGGQEASSSGAGSEPQPGALSRS